MKMKSCYLRLILILVLFSGYADLFAQNTWTKMAGFPGQARRETNSFSIGHYGIVGGGNNGSSNFYDFYKWDQNTNSWGSIASYPGTGSYSGLAFSCEGKGYEI